MKLKRIDPPLKGGDERLFERKFYLAKIEGAWVAGLFELSIKFGWIFRSAFDLKGMGWEVREIKDLYEIQEK